MEQANLALLIMQPGIVFRLDPNTNDSLIAEPRQRHLLNRCHVSVREPREEFVDPLFAPETLERLFDIAERASQLTPSVRINNKVVGCQHDYSIEHIIAAVLVDRAITLTKEGEMPSHLSVRIPTWLVESGDGQGKFEGLTEVGSTDVLVELCTSTELRTLRLPLNLLHPEGTRLAYLFLRGVKEVPNEEDFIPRDNSRYRANALATRHTKEYHALAIKLFELLTELTGEEEKFWNVLAPWLPENQGIARLFQHFKAYQERCIADYVEATVSTQPVVWRKSNR